MECRHASHGPERVCGELFDGIQRANAIGTRALLLWNTCVWILQRGRSVWHAYLQMLQAGLLAGNEELLRDVLEVAAEPGAVPELITGDFNIDPRRSAALRSAVATGLWCDVAASFATASGSDVQPTCFKNIGSPGTRIDAMMANSVLSPAVKDFAILPDVNFPTHRAIQAKLCTDAYSQTVLQYVKPRAFPVKSWLRKEHEEEEALALEALLCQEKVWRKAVQEEEMEAMWRAWCRAGAAATLAALKLGSTPALRRTGNQRNGMPLQSSQRGSLAHPISTNEEYKAQFVDVRNCAVIGFDVLSRE